MKIRKYLLGLVVASASAAPAFADTYVNGHIRRDGTYVQPHYRTDADSNRFNNYSTQGNTNPYTGQRGSVDPYAQPSRGGYGSSNGSSNNGLYGSGSRRW